MQYISPCWNSLRPAVHEKWIQWWIARHPLRSHIISIDSWNHIFNGGKEIRPKLYCELYSHLVSHTHTPIGDLAFAIECIHVASLLLDDLPYMDNASVRRKKQTCHLLFSVEDTITFAIDILSIVIQIWTAHEPLKNTIKHKKWWFLLQSKLLQLCTGQIIDLIDSDEHIFNLALLKTGTLFELVTELVAVQLEFGEERTIQWRNWGRKIGILFQWADDWSDIEEDKLANNKNVFTILPLNDMTVLYRVLYDSIDLGPSWISNVFIASFYSYFENAVPFNGIIGETAEGYNNILASTVSAQFPCGRFANMVISSDNIQANITSRLFKRMSMFTPFPEYIEKFYIDNVSRIEFLSSMTQFIKNVYNADKTLSDIFTHSMIDTDIPHDNIDNIKHFMRANDILFK